MGAAQSGFAVSRLKAAGYYYSTAPLNPVGDLLGIRSPCRHFPAALGMEDASAHPSATTLLLCRSDPAPNNEAHPASLVPGTVKLWESPGRAGGLPFELQ